MGKKNKQQNTANKPAEGKKDALKGISQKSKNIVKNPLAKAQNKKEASNPKAVVNKLKNKQNKKPQVVEKEENIANGDKKQIEEKKPKQKHLKIKSTGVKKVTKATSKKETGKVEQVEKPEDNVVLKLNKRNKNRLKSEMKKEIILKGKDPAILNKKNLLENKLKKLIGKPEPRSKKVQRKILLIELLLNKIKESNKKNHIKEIPVASIEQDSDDDKPKPKNKNVNGVKKAKNKQKKSEESENGKSEESKQEGKNFPRNQNVVFVGNLPVDITKETLLEVFSSVNGIQKVRIPRKRASKSRRFAYIQLENEEAKMNMFKMHGTLIDGRPVNILYADRKKGKLTAENAKLLEQKKALNLTDAQSMEIGKQLKKKKKNKKNKKQQNKTVKPDSE